MSKHWMDKVWSWDHCFNALALAAGLPRTGLGPVPAALRPPGRRRRPARLRHPLRDPLQLRQAAHPRLGPAPAAPTLVARSTTTNWPRSTTGWTAGPTSGSTTGAPPATSCPTTSTATTAAGTTPPPSTSSASSRRADLAAFLVLQLRELADLADRARPARGLRSLVARRPTRMRDRAARRAVDRRPVRRPGGVRPGRTWTSASLLDLMPIVLGRASCPTRSATRWPSGIETHLTAYGLATELPTSPHYQADGYWRGPDLGAVHRPHRGRAAPRRVRRARRRDQRAVPRPVREIRLRRELRRPSPARAYATAPTPGPRAPTSSSPPPASAGTEAEGRLSPGRGCGGFQVEESIRLATARRREGTRRPAFLGGESDPCPYVHLRAHRPCAGASWDGSGVQPASSSRPRIARLIILP